MLSTATLLDDLESSMRQGSGARRIEILQRVTQLFLRNAEAHREEHVALFDDVLIRLIDRIEEQALVRLSTQLAPVGNAPTRVVRQLAQSDNIEVSRPVLQQSTVLTDDDLVELARSKSQGHLAAIAERVHVAEKVTDILVERGDSTVASTVTGNAGARFSRKALLKVAERANMDANLAECIVNRSDVPPDVFEHLLHKATDVVRQRLLKNANPELKGRINQVLGAIAQQVSTAVPTSGRTVAGHSAAILLHQDIARLKTHLGELARVGDRAQIVDTISILSKLPIETIRGLLRADAEDGVIILCKAIGLGWPDARNVLAVMTGMPSDADNSKQAFEKYRSLSEETAQRVIRFVKSCKAVSKADLQRML